MNPTDIAGLNEQMQSWAGSGEILRPVNIRQLVMADDALDAMVEIVQQYAGGGKVLLFCDHTPKRRDGTDLLELITSRLAHKVQLTSCCWPTDPTASFHADIESARKLSGQLDPYVAMVSVGSGSVTDVAKYARHLALEQGRANLPLICFPTAASVTAFTSALAVLTVDGVKRTLASRAPTAVVCDLRTIADAPAAMTRAGFGDVLARSVAYGDWYLAHQLGMDDSFSAVPARLLGDAEQVMIELADKVGRRDLEGVRAVMRAVLLAGMAMSVVNQTAPISGWEHVISHFLDMTASHDGRSPALHGGQVGVATLVAARGYERTWLDLDLDRIAAVMTDRQILREYERIERIFRPFDSTGAMAAEVRRDYCRKIERWRDHRGVRRQFAERKAAGEFESFMDQNVRSSLAIRDALRRAHAPLRFEELNIPVPHATALAAVRYSHLIRARFTLGDLLDRAGRMDELFAEALLGH